MSTDGGNHAIPHSWTDLGGCFDLVSWIPTVKLPVCRAQMLPSVERNFYMVGERTLLNSIEQRVQDTSDSNVQGNGHIT